MAEVSDDRVKCDLMLRAMWTISCSEGGIGRSDVKSGSTVR